MIFTHPETGERVSFAPNVDGGSRAYLSTCRHDRTEVRIWEIMGGRFAAHAQCLDCGAKVGPAMRQADYPKAPPVDQTLVFQWKDQIERRQAEIDETSRELYSSYLRSPEWRERRRLVFRRAGGTCEGCGVAPAVEVHHTTYEHIYRELLWELRAVCHRCHDIAHGVDVDAEDEDQGERA